MDYECRLGRIRHPRLVDLAFLDQNRAVVLAGRDKRRRKKPRTLTCVACNIESFTDRHDHDICERCLITLWEAQTGVSSR